MLKELRLLSIQYKNGKSFFQRDYKKASHDIAASILHWHICQIMISRKPTGKVRRGKNCYVNDVACPFDTRTEKKEKDNFLYDEGLKYELLNGEKTDIE